MIFSFMPFLFIWFH